MESFNENKTSSLISINDENFLLKLDGEKLKALKKTNGEFIVADNIMEYLAACTGDKVLLVVKDKDNKYKSNLFFEKDIFKNKSLTEDSFSELINKGKNLSINTVKFEDEKNCYLIGKRKNEPGEKLVLYKLKNNEIIKNYDNIDEGDHIILTVSSFQIDSNGNGHLCYVLVRGENYFVFYRHVTKKGKLSSPYLIKKSEPTDVYDEPVLVVDKDTPYIFWVIIDKNEYNFSLYFSKVTNRSFSTIMVDGSTLVSNKKLIKYLCAGKSKGKMWAMWWNNGMEGCIQRKNTENWLDIYPPSILTAVRYSSSNFFENRNWGKRAYCLFENLSLYTPALTEENIKKNKNYGNRRPPGDSKVKNRKPTREELLEKMREKYNVQPDTSAKDDFVKTNYEGIDYREEKNDKREDLLNKMREKYMISDKEKTALDEKAVVFEDKERGDEVELNKEQVINNTEDKPQFKEKSTKVEKELEEEKIKRKELMKENEALKKQIKELKEEVKKKEQEKITKTTYSIGKGNNKENEKIDYKREETINKIKEDDDILHKHLEELKKIKEYTKYLEEINKNFENLTQSKKEKTAERKNVREKRKESKLRKIFR